MSSGTVIMAEPVCLIEKDKDGNLGILPQAVEILKQIDQPVVVVAVVGPYRAGKSYLMNKLAGKRKGFALGACIQPKTKGIWMWCIPHPRKAGHTLVLLDTEGLGSMEIGDMNDDNWIFSLAVLLSSALVYNSMRTIDSVAIQQLHYVTELTEHIKVNLQASDEDKSTEFKRFFPSFVWTVRDFTLELEYDGEEITADQYLENALELKPGCDDYNLPRKCLLNYFPTRKCFVFGRPASEKKMKRMEDLSDEDLKPSFVRDAKRFCDYILSEVKAKTIKEGYNMPGRMLGSLAEMYLGAISSGQIPCLENAVVSLARTENTNAVAKAVKFYKENMAERVVFPTETEEDLSDIHGEVEERAVNIFIDLCFMNEDQTWQIGLKNLLQTEYTAICDKNVVESKEACESIIKRIFKPLEDNIASKKYESVGGYQQYCEDLERFTSQYRSAEGKGIKGEESLNEYLARLEPVGEAIKSADKSLRKARKTRRILTGVGTAVGIVAGAGLAVVAVPVAVVGLGFTAAGITAGSTAAGMMSAAAIANGGAVAAGSAVAVLQSLGAVGLSATAAAVVSSVGATIGGAIGNIASRFVSPFQPRQKK
ncbi:hypothetical protein SKAU_G00421150 [Synaphobranchus kaupii]|uniref:GB1/RHD3-type G domain-containing protein n=1 Tax=Synaphobranchus kaupii TaxID=118154 RepID=A0A9Q1E6N4_SYNKA|nr:hypothetical protein SKAU_G00421150 [Synaphobranchus kaupii]